mmetsp:Transcript_20712/g.46114  ORF Transcript_20712/g.46114 Transcript_20712/m.46114 type:complete len:899 (+) Transcript_20712:2041-4737(+)
MPDLLWLGCAPLCSRSRLLWRSGLSGLKLKEAAARPAQAPVERSASETKDLQTMAARLEELLGALDGPGQEVVQALATSLKSLDDLEMELELRASDLQNEQRKLETKVKRGVGTTKDVELCKRKVVEAVAAVDEARGRKQSALGQLAEYLDKGLVEVVNMPCFIDSVKQCPAHVFAEDSAVRTRLMKDGIAPARDSEKEEVGGVSSALFLPHDLAGFGQVTALPGRRRGKKATGSNGPVFLRVFPDKEMPAFERELRALANWKHDGIVGCIGYLIDPRGDRVIQGVYYEATLAVWRERVGSDGVLSSDEVETFARALDIVRGVLNTLGWLHEKCVTHGRLRLTSVLLDESHRPLLCDFTDCVDRSVQGSVYADDPSGRDWRPPTACEAPEVLRGQPAEPPADVYAIGAMLVQVFLGRTIEVNACPYNRVTQLRSLPMDHSNSDLMDLIHCCLSEDPLGRPSAATACGHRVFSPVGFLQREGRLRAVVSVETHRVDLNKRLQLLHEQHRSFRVDEALGFERDRVFEALVAAKLPTWSVEKLLGDWRVHLDGEQGVDAGGMRREAMALAFEQLMATTHVIALGDPPVLLVGRNRTPDWRNVWVTVGLLTLRCLVHFQVAPCAISSLVFDCCLGRITRLPPDHRPGGAADIGDLAVIRSQRGDDWGRGELNDLLRRVKAMDPQRESSYRWLIAAAGKAMSEEDRAVVEDMLEPCCWEFYAAHGPSAVHWAVLWDLYLKFIGGPERWEAYDALMQGLTASGKYKDLWEGFTGDRIVEALGGQELTADLVLANIEYQPAGRAYAQQVAYFEGALNRLSAKELAQFLRFTTGLDRINLDGALPNHQKLVVRWVPVLNQDPVEYARLPQAHTCYFTVDMPPYRSEEEMLARLRTSIEAPQPFALQ